MEKFDLSISTKNIGYIGWDSYEKKMMDSGIELICKMRWKIFYYKEKLKTKGLHINQNSMNNNEFYESIIREENTDVSYGLKSIIQAPPDADLKAFERDFIQLLCSLKKRDFKSSFQSEILQIEKRIKETEKLIIESDKTGNFYLVDPLEYKRFLHNCITKKYQRVNEDYLNMIDCRNAQIARELGLEWKLELTSRNPAFLKIKDHKPTFPGKIDFRLINAMKNPLGRISKKILERIIFDVREKTNLNQWQSTSAAINWFENLKNKNKLSFFQFDIEEFYPNISKPLLIRAIAWAKQY